MHGVTVRSSGACHCRVSIVVRHGDKRKVTLGACVRRMDEESRTLWRPLRSVSLWDCCSACDRVLLVSATCGCWRNGFIRPVLKHGPRSLTCVRVLGGKPRGAMKVKVSLSGSVRRTSTDRSSVKGLSKSILLGPERW